MGAGIVAHALGLSRATLYRALQPPAPLGEDGLVVDSRYCARALTLEERRSVLDVLCSACFVDVAPAEVHASLLDEGVYLCSVSTMQRLLRKQGASKERRNQRQHLQYKAPELLAVRPNELWSWDITRLKGPVKRTYFYLYVIMDVFSRRIVGWTAQHQESAQIAEEMIAQACQAQGIKPEQLTIHADRGSAMTSRGVAQLMADLGITKTHSRPHVSNDNAYSEAHFKTLKYRPDFPGRFGSIQDVRAHCRVFMDWYNNEHRHSGIGMMTPEAVHSGRAEQMRGERQVTLLRAYGAHPERFVNKIPQPPPLPEAAWINPPARQSTLVLCGNGQDLKK